MLTVGENFLRYKIISLIGSGGMGEVYLARDRQLERNVAIKILRPKVSHRSGDSLERFMLEARSASALNHPNIITIYEIGEVDSSHYIASEFIEGKTLHELVGQKSLALSEILNIVIQTAEALAAAHSAGIVHRDIKPENIMIRDDGYVKVLDFGLAKLSEHERALTDVEDDTKRMVMTNPGVVMGTVSYMSPEQTRGRPVDRRTDIWSLGVVVYEMVTRRRPFTGETTSDVIAAILRSEPEPIVSLAPETPKELELIVDKTLRKDRDQRYQHIKDLLVDLKDLRRDLEMRMREDTLDLRATQDGRSLHSTDGKDGRARTTADHGLSTGSINDIFRTQFRLHPILVTAVVVAVLAGLGAAGYGIRRLIGSNGSESFQSMRLARLTSSGQTVSGVVAISSDGNYVAYAAKDEGPQQSLWVRQATTSGNVRIVAPGSFSFTGVTFSRDGRFIYFTAFDSKGQTGVYRIATLGGDSQRVIADASGPVSLSPDDARLALVRRDRELVIANSDGSNAVTRLVADNSEALWLPTWSPDGKTIVLRTYTALDSLVRLAAVSVNDGTRTSVGSDSWYYIGGLAWLPDGSGLLFTGRDLETQSSQIWFASYPDGKLSRVTNDLGTYIGISLSDDGKTAVTTQESRQSNIWTTDEANPDKARRLTEDLGRDDGLSGVVWAPDGRIVYTTRIAATQDLWVSDPANGSNRQLTFNTGSNYNPAVTPDGKYVVFVSNRTGNLNLWRIEIDGNNPIQLTDSPGIERQPSITPDGKWVFYAYSDHERRGSIWKVPVEGGEPVQVVAEQSSEPKISPDGKLFACKFRRANESMSVAIFSIDGGAPIQQMSQRELIGSPVFKWSPDGRSILYIASSEHGSGLWSQPLDNGERKLLTEARDQLIWAFDVSGNNNGFVFARGSETSDAIMINNFR